MHAYLFFWYKCCCIVTQYMPTVRIHSMPFLCCVLGEILRIRHESGQTQATSRALLTSEPQRSFKSTWILTLYLITNPRLSHTVAVLPECYKIYEVSLLHKLNIGCEKDKHCRGRREEAWEECRLIKQASPNTSQVLKRHLIRPMLHQTVYRFHHYGSGYRP